MAEDDIQAKPLAPADGPRSHSVEDAAISADLHQKFRRHRKLVRLCGCLTVAALALIAIITILAFTVFRVKDPKIRLNSISIRGLKIDATTLTTPQINMTLVADVSIKNPNAASFKFGNGTTSVYYHGITVGEVWSPPGRARARRTVRMNLTVVVNGEKLLSAPGLLSDVRSGSLIIDSYTTIGGRVQIINVIKKHLVVEMNCTMTVLISSQEIQEQMCTSHASL
ncbi:hypothetical protein Nepgr_024520 [Nepenthes gracilis]|uniref:Late embryogenesis abundant protein LEA-2 subgroup domain-containing protein n=1 Tax=Nepenthes gracilis TaxID=150966 RepID=A0AAD3XYP2_NEPGR|nr:hypothetical protein Nepgr_024520 [Nepenthes gracilis]